MAFGRLPSRKPDAPMSDINVTPMVDVMLVLLVIFIITAPLLTHAVKIDLPKASSAPNELRADNIQIAIDGAAQLFWNGERIERAQLLERLREAGIRQPSPELHLRVDRNARYETVADVMSEAGKAGVTKIGFVTDPSGSLIAPVMKR